MLISVIDIYSECNNLQNIMLTLTSVVDINNSFYLFLMELLLLKSGDIECNPGPDIAEHNCFSILHQNIRSIRNKLEFIKNNFLDFDMLCFTETHLSVEINDNALQLDGFDKMYRKDNSAHSGGFLVYASSHLRPKRILELDNYLSSSLWVQVKDNAQSFIIGTIYRPPHYTVAFWEQLNICLEKANELNNNIISSW